MRGNWDLAAATILLFAIAGIFTLCLVTGW